MKYKYILPIVALAGMSLMSCDDDKMDWYKDPSHGEVTVSELPLQLAEKIARYDILKNYSDFTLGVGVGLDLYMEDEAYRKIVEENFDQITIGYNMKHGPMVNSKGELNFKPIDELFTRLQSVGLGLYGHTLVWHSNQNASYLNSLIAPEVIPGSDGDNLLTNGDFENGDTGWGSWGGAKDKVEITSDVKLGGNNALKIVAKDNATNLWDIQVQAPAVPLIIGHQYEISFWVKSESNGGVRLSFGDASQMSSQYPSLETEGEFAATSSTWKQVVYSTSTIYSATDSPFVAVGNSMQFRLDFGKFPNVTYYIDNVTVTDLDAEPSVVNLVTNGTFDNDLEGWSKWNGANDAMTRATESEAYQGGGALKVRNDADANEWSTQIHTNFSEAWEADKNYRISFMIRSDAPGSARCSTTGSESYQSSFATTNVWTEVVWEPAVKGGEAGLNFDLGKVAGTYYIDNLVVQKISNETRKATNLRSGPIIIEKTTEEKAQIIGAAMESWISQMVTHCKGLVKAWDVVNEPMDDGKPSSLKTGVGKTDLASDEFYWQDYLGKDYAVKAFNLARQYGNPDDKLFINDYNLEYNLAKCDGLIEFVKYIDSHGAQVDGIGTQMHIGIDTNKDNIAQMFQKLGATGKLIKVTELDIKVNTSTPTTEQLAQQAEMYRYVIDMYKKYVPEGQRHSFTIWGISDSAKEHEYWIPNDGPNVWDANYERKHAYKGVADGLAGRDVSESFTGELEY